MKIALWSLLVPVALSLALPLLPGLLAPERSAVVVSASAVSDSPARLATAAHEALAEPAHGDCPERARLVRM